MAYNVPSAVASGDAVTASLYNTYVKDNIIALKAVPTILQVVSFATSAQDGKNGTGYIDSSVTLNITPSSSASKVLVFVTMNGVHQEAQTVAGLKLLRGATTLVTNFGFSNSTAESCSTVYLDSPATTSATTYKVQWACGGGTDCYLQWGGAYTSNITLMEVQV
jgi:hypothetical protein